MICYRVNNKTFYNTFLAAHESYLSGAMVEMYCYDQEYDQLDWQREPEESFESLCGRYALTLRERYERLILLYSGGTDSHTIYKIFLNNNIHLDEIIIKTSNHNPAYPYRHFSWVANNHPDPTTVITQYDGDHDGLRSKEIENDDWIFEDRGEIYKFGMPVAARGVQHLCEKNHGGLRWTAITGMEKPRLVYRNHHWWSRQLDTVLRQVMGYDYVTNFFLEPMIHLKQSHMTKRAVKKIIAEKSLPLHDNDWAEAKWPKTAQGYQDWAAATGRFTELSPTISFLQKQLNNEIFQADVPNLEQSSPEAVMRELYDTGDSTARHFVNGYKNLMAEKDFVDWLSHSFLRHSGTKKFVDTKFIWSKEYDLGP